MAATVLPLGRTRQQGICDAADEPPMNGRIMSNTGVCRFNSVDARIAVVVDLDKALLRTDRLWESILQLCRHDVKSIISLLQWFFLGGGSFRQRVCTRSELDLSLLPVRREFVDWLERQHAAGRRIVGVTAGGPQWAEQVASRFSFIDEIVACAEVAPARDRLGKGRDLRERFPQGFI